MALTTDASDTGMGAVLEQLNPSSSAWEPLAFFSKNFKDSQKRYSTFDRELLAIRSAIKHFRYLLDGRDFTVFTDHKPLTFIGSQVNPDWSAIQSRMIDKITQATTDIRHVQGKDNPVADSLSRIHEVEASFIDWKCVAKDQLEDDECIAAPVQNSGLKLKWIQMDGYRILCDISQSTPRPFIPKSWRMAVMKHVHNFSHDGSRSSVKKVLSMYIWPSAKKDVSKFVQSCDGCQRSKVHRHTKHPIQNIDPPTGRFRHIHVDLVGPLPESNGFRYLFTIVDRWTRWQEAIPLKEMTADSCARALLDNWISRFGVPEIISSDRGRQFISKLWDQMSCLFGFKHSPTISYHPQANGMVERFHRSLKASLMSRFKDSTSWHKELPIVMLGLRTALKEDLGHSSAEMVYGENLRLPGFFYEKMSITTPEPFIKSVIKKVGKLPMTQPKRHGDTPSFVDKKLRSCSHVMVRQDKVRPALSSPYLGPFEVISKERDYFVINFGDRQDSVTIDRLKPAFLAKDLLPDLKELKTSRSGRVIPATF